LQNFERVLQILIVEPQARDHTGVLITRDEEGGMSSAQPPAAHEEIARRAHRRWEERGALIGSPEVDGDRAEELVRDRAEHSG
jgi:hypothetical protein